MQDIQKLIVNLINGLVENINAGDCQVQLGRINTLGETSKPKQSFIHPIDEDQDDDSLDDYDEDEDDEDCYEDEYDEEDQDQSQADLANAQSLLINLINSLIDQTNEEEGYEAIHKIKVNGANQKTEKFETPFDDEDDEPCHCKTSFQKRLEEADEDEDDDVEEEIPIKSRIFDFVEANGSCTRDQIKKFIVENILHEKYDKIKNKYTYDHIFSPLKAPSYWTYDDVEDRFFTKDGRGLYKVVR